jgi:cytochrome b561
MYPLPNRILHWLTLALVIAAFASIELREMFEKGTENRELFKFVHFQIGASLFLLTLIRLVNNKFSPGPKIVDMSKLKMFLAKAVHTLLLICLILLPILGVSILIAEAKDVTVLGLELPNLMPADKDIAHLIEDIHGTVANVFMFLIFAHAAAAIWHHKIAKDDTLKKMLGSK